MVEVRRDEETEQRYRLVIDYVLDGVRDRFEIEDENVPMSVFVQDGHGVTFERYLGDDGTYVEARADLVCARRLILVGKAKGDDDLDGAGEPASEERGSSGTS